MVLAAVARAVAKGAKSAGKKVARAAKAGDASYNARRRYTRAAERNLKKAEQSSGATAARYRNLARQDLDKALATYEQGTTQGFSKPMQKIAGELGVDLEQSRRSLQAMKKESAAKRQEAAISRSETRLAGAMEDAEALRQAEAQAVFSSEIGHRILGGLVDVWKPKAVYTKEGVTKVDKEKMFQALFDYFKVDNLADMLAIIEKNMGEGLYEEGDSDTLYETVKLTIQNKVADNTLVS